MSPLFDMDIKFNMQTNFPNCDMKKKTIYYVVLINLSTETSYDNFYLFHAFILVTAI